MKILLPLIFVVICQGKFLSEDYDTIYLQWLSKYSKSYTSKSDFHHRKQIFIDNIKQVDKLNQEFNGKTRFGLTKFADMTLEEFKHRVNGGQPKQKVENIHYEPSFTTARKVSLPLHVDWRDSDFVSDVKDQGACNSHWAIAVADALETSFGIDYLIDSGDLSVQQLVDCVPKEPQTGCHQNIDVNTTLTYVMQYGMQDDDSYTYMGYEQPCQYDKSQVIYTPGGFEAIKPLNDQDFKTHVVDRPIIIEVEADTELFQFYQDGILQNRVPDECGQYVQHKMVVVGYDDQLGYWLIKNSWGIDWGEDGYVRIGYSTPPGQCGIYQRPMAIKGYSQP